MKLPDRSWPAFRIVDGMLGPGLPQALRDAALHLALQQHGIQG